MAFTGLTMTKKNASIGKTSMALLAQLDTLVWRLVAFGLGYFFQLFSLMEWDPACGNPRFWNV